MNPLKSHNRGIWYVVGVACLISAAYAMDTLDDMTTNAVIQAFVLAIRNVIHITLIPLFGVFMIDHIGKPEDYRNPRWMNCLCIPAFAILVGIFTNDAHQLAFCFPKEIVLFDSEYGYGPIYFMAMAWFVLLGIYFVAMLLKKSRVPGRRGMQTLPAVIMGGAVVFWTLYCFGFFRGCDLTVVDCLIIGLLLESAVQSGLIPSNTNYQELFHASSVAAQIVNEAYEPTFQGWVCAVAG